MQIVNDKSQCCGCTACVNSCPLEHKAIKMSFDEEGFLYPVIDENKCIDCHACINACFYHTGKMSVNRVSRGIDSYAIITKDKELLNKSQSGGAFGEIARYVLNNNGVVYGAAITKNGVVKHQRVTDIKELYKLHGSKYVQSQMNENFSAVKNDLQSDRWVLFSGTPCQVMGLKKYLKKSYSKLVLVDIICYGVPSPKLWEKFLESYILKNVNKLRRIIFRDKSFGWNVCKTVIEFGDEKVVTDAWTKLWGAGNALRPSCYQCKFSNLERPGDLTVGDCWGIDKVYPELETKKGVSLLLVNTEMGVGIFNKLKNSVECHDVNIDLVMQPRLLEPTKRPKTRERFWHDFREMDFNKFIYKYTKSTIREIIKEWVAKFIKFK